MAFTIVETLYFTRNVPVQIPVDDGHREEKLRTKFKVLADEEDQVSLIDNPMNKAFLRKAIVEFSDVEGVDGAPRPHSGELLEELIALPFVRTALVQAYFNAVAKVAAGN